MKFSLVTLLTITAFIAWVLAVSQMPHDLRRIVIPVSFLLVVVTLFVIAMTMPKDSSGQLDYENSTLANSMEPMFKMVFGTIVLTIIALVVALFLAVFVYSIW